MCHACIRSMGAKIGLVGANTFLQMRDQQRPEIRLVVRTEPYLSAGRHEAFIHHVKPRRTAFAVSTEGFSFDIHLLKFPLSPVRILWCERDVANNHIALELSGD